MGPTRTRSLHLQLLLDWLAGPGRSCGGRTGYWGGGASGVGGSGPWRLITWPGLPGVLSSWRGGIGEAPALCTAPTQQQ